MRIALVGAGPNDLPERLGLDQDVEWTRDGEDPQAIVLGGEVRNAFELIEEALQGGRSVFCLVPLGFSSRQMATLLELSAAQSRILRFSEPYRYLGGFPLLRRLLGGREPFWRPSYVRSEWFAAGNDVRSLKAMAMLDLALYDSVFLAEPRSVLASAFDDDATSGPCAITLSIAYQDSPSLQCTVSRVEVVEEHEFVAIAPERKVTLDQRDETAGLAIAGIERAAAPPVLKRLDSTMNSETALMAEFADFVRSVASSDLSFTNAERWLRVSAVWSAARRSMRSGRRVDAVRPNPGNTTPPPLLMIEGGGGSKRTTGPRPALTLVAG